MTKNIKSKKNSNKKLLSKNDKNSKDKKNSKIPTKNNNTKSKSKSNINQQLKKILLEKLMDKMK